MVKIKQVSQCAYSAHSNKVVLLPILPPPALSIAAIISALLCLTLISCMQIWQMASNIYEDDFQQGPKA